MDFLIYLACGVALFLVQSVLYALCVAPRSHAVRGLGLVLTVLCSLAAIVAATVFSFGHHAFVRILAAWALAAIVLWTMARCALLLAAPREPV